MSTKMKVKAFLKLNMSIHNEYKNIISKIWVFFLVVPFQKSFSLQILKWWMVSVFEGLLNILLAIFLSLHVYCHPDLLERSVLACFVSPCSQAQWLLGGQVFYWTLPLSYVACPLQSFNPNVTGFQELPWSLYIKSSSAVV